MTVPAVVDFSALSTLAGAGRITQTSLELDRPDGEAIPFDDYVRLGGYLGTMNRSCSWWVGDWLNYGEGAYGERFSQAEDATGLAEDTLAKRMRTCAGIPRSRRRANVSFSIHSEVAHLTAREQNHWLAEAERNGWSLRQFRAAVRAAAREEEGVQQTLDDGEPMSQEAIIDAARAVIRSRKEYGADWLVPREAMARLAAAIGAGE